MLAADLSDVRLDDLRTCAKRRESSTREKLKGKHFERQHELVSVDDPNLRFRVFMRRNITLRHVFSVGLTLILPEQDLVLCRYNGADHTHRNRIENTKLGFGHHIHVATARYITANMDPDGFAEPTDRFQDAFSALACMVTDCGLGGILPTPADPDTPDLFP